MGPWGGQAAFLEWEWVPGDGTGWGGGRVSMQLRSPLLSGGFRAMRHKGVGQEWRQAQLEDGVRNWGRAHQMRSGGLVRSCAVCTGHGTLAYLSSGDSSRTCLVVCPQGCYPTVAISFIPPLMLRVMVWRQGTTSSPHTPESAHPSSFYYQGPSSERFELWVSYPWDLEVHRPHSVAQATSGVLVPRRAPSFSEVWGKISPRVLRVALSLCMSPACSPSMRKKDACQKFCLCLERPCAR